MKVNIELSSRREMNLAVYLTGEDLENLGGPTRDFVVFRGADKCYLESKAILIKILKVKLKFGGLF